MKRLETWGFLAVCAVALLVVPGVAVGDSDNAAQVFHDGGCILGQAASGLDIPLGPQQQTGYHKVFTSGGTAVLTCKFAIPEGHEPAKAIVNSGFVCSAFDPEAGVVRLTTDTTSRATPGGVAILTCQFKKQ